MTQIPPYVKELRWARESNYNREIRERVPIEIGEHVIVKDGPLATSWYCAEVSRVERNWMEINYYTTITPSLEDYATAGRQARTD